MERRCKTLNIIEAKSQRSSIPASQSHHRSQPSQLHHIAKTRTQQTLFKNSSLLTTNSPPTSPCVFCEQPSHSAFSCEKFVNLSLMDRFKLTKELKLCLNCLRGRHTANHCTSTNKCQKCGDTHHTLLHRERIAPAISKAPAPSNADVQQTVQPQGNPPPLSSSTSLQASHTDDINRDAGYVLLATALLSLSNEGGTSVVGRTLLDSCSQLNFITEHIAQHLKLNRSRTYLDVNGIGQVSTIVHQRAQLCVSSLHNSFSVYLDVIILPEITSPQPSRYINTKNWKIPSNTQLSDPRFNLPGAVDCLIGAGIYFDLLQFGQIKLGENLPSLQKTLLEWIVGGTIKTYQKRDIASSLDVTPVGPNSPSINYTCFTTTTTPSIEELLQQFWTIEDNHTPAKKLSIEEEECETFFKSTTTRCPLTNKFIVQLLFREGRTLLGNSYDIAKNRLISIERKIYRSPSVQKDYCHFIDEYARLDHMTKLDAAKAIQDDVNYIPHHCVLKPDSSTTKLRVVFDASCKTSSGKSLNDIMKVGPTLQNDIFTILVRFRTHRFVLMADITQMYRQILVSPKDTNTQCILWPNSKTKAIESYMLKTVTYGTSCAPYLAVRCLRLLAEEGSEQFPIGSAVTLRDFYVDNLMSGANDRSEALQIKDETTRLLLSGGFHLRKWASNDPTIIADVLEEDRESFIVLGDSEIIKALGMGWDPKEDNFRFSYIEFPSNKSNKRCILSQISQKGRTLKSSIQQLAPFLKDALIRVGGRIVNSPLPYDAMHPLLLPKSNQFVYTLIRHYHYNNKHAGPQTLHNILRQRFWILDVKGTIRRVVHRCLMCYRNKPVLAQQIMGNLPCERVTPSLPFRVTGLDYCGPLNVSHRIRGRAPFKTYLAIFVCFTTKAVHLELVSDLSTSAFILALKRFIARRGKCIKIHSDNASNFTGANRELRDLYALFMSEHHNDIIREECLQDGIEWSFIPPRSPNFGGLWEAAVKVAKHHLRRIIGQAVLSFEEMTTVCCQIEAVMNSRPLTPMSSNPNDLTALTPGHFLVGTPLTSIAEPSIESCNISNLKRYQYLQWIQQNFWRRWTHDYLRQLQLRKQWNSLQPNIHINELVLLKEDNTPPLKWPMGRIIEIYSGDDGNIRVASVKTSTGTYKRAISKLCPLPLEIDPEESNKEV